MGPVLQGIVEVKENGAHAAAVVPHHGRAGGRGILEDLLLESIDGVEFGFGTEKFDQGYRHRAAVKIAAEIRDPGFGKGGVGPYGGADAMLVTPWVTGPLPPPKRRRRRISGG